MHSSNLKGTSSVFTYQQQQQPPPTSSSSAGKRMDIMCDTSQVTTAPSNVATGSMAMSQSQGGKQQMSMESSSSGGNNPGVNNNLGNSNGQGFLAGLLPAAMLQQQVQQQQQQQNSNNNMGPSMHGHGLGGMETNQHNQHPHPQQQPPHSMHHGMHSIQGNACSVIPAHLMDNHHHHHPPQNISHHQQGGHQMPHGPAHPPSHAHHSVPHHHPHPGQQFLPFGMNFNSNNMGNNGGPSNQHMNPFHGYHHGPQIPNQQPAHAMNMGMTPLQQTCFMQHSACMQHFQQNPQSLLLNNHNHRGPGAGGWMNGPGPGPSMPIANPNNVVPGNHSSVQNNNVPPCVPSSQNTTKIVATPKNQPPPPPDPNAVPGGLEILWRELPVDCQKLIVPQDIPDSARFRGYFTVCELLQLKRALEARYLGVIKAHPSQIQQAPASKASNSSKAEGGRKALKRGGGHKERNSNKIRVTENYNGNNKGINENRQSQGDSEMHSQNNDNMNNNNMGNCEQRAVPEDHDENSLGELMISLDSMKHDNIHTEVTPPVSGVGVGGVVKEAMDALTTSTSTTDQNGCGGDHSTCGMNKENEDVVLCSGKDSDSDELVINESETNHDSNNVGTVVTEATNASPEANNSNMLENMNHQKEASNSNNNGMPGMQMLPSMPGFSNLFAGKKNGGIGENMSATTSSCNNTTACVTITEAEQKHDQEDAECHKQLQIALNSISGESSTNHLTSNVNVNTSVAASMECCNAVQGPVDNNRYPAPPPPPYRTATLVIKLLQIGSYHIRSFSGLNPNRLRVLFNTQRMTYECQLPILPGENPGGSGPTPNVRKVLTVDIGFDQITMIKFGIDSMWMRVEGPPLLTISVNPAQDEAPNQHLTLQDQFLLDQIEKGQLKLSPIHQLFFINERLVQSLESQLREHPRFRHMLAANGPHPYSHHL